MATQTNKTRTITGFIADLLEYPRWVLEREVDFTNCRYGGHYNSFIKECSECQFGTSCRWLDQNRSRSLEGATVEELTDALETEILLLQDLPLAASSPAFQELASQISPGHAGLLSCQR